MTKKNKPKNKLGQKIDKKTKNKPKVKNEIKVKKIIISIRRQLNISFLKFFPNNLIAGRREDINSSIFTSPK